MIWIRVNLLCVLTNANSNALDVLQIQTSFCSFVCVVFSVRLLFGETRGSQTKMNLVLSSRCVMISMLQKVLLSRTGHN